MGVAEYQLLADAVHHIVKGKQPLLLGHAGMKHHLKQYVAQLFLQVGCVPVIDGFGHLIGLLQHIAPDGLVGLFSVPGAPLRSAEQLHDAEKVLHGIVVHTLKIYHNFASLSSHFIYFQVFQEKYLKSLK